MGRPTPTQEQLLERALQRFTVNENGCWIWHKANFRGYGAFWAIDRPYEAHRWLYLALGNTIPEGYQLDHLCKVTLCVNPDHLEPVTPAENTRRSMFGKHEALKTHCPQGHEYLPENIMRRKDHPTWRACKQCNRDKALRNYYAKKARRQSASA